MRYIVLLLFQFTLIAQSPSITYINSDTTWSSDVSISGKVVVKSGATLTIAAGTVVKATFTANPVDVTVLVVARGGKIEAAGTADKPIIFTSEFDDLTAADVAAGTYVSTEGGAANDLTTRGLWAGIIMLGKGIVGEDGGEDDIEGVAEGYDFTTYGGSVANDNSGTLDYVSIRHGGATIANGDEINGLTLGGVGSGTTISNIEIISNDDDGIEFFGGNVDVTNILIFNQKDDAIDIDEAYAGTITNAYVAMGADSDNVFEIDGSEDSTGTVTGSYTIDGVTAYQAYDNSGKLDQYGHWKAGATGANNNIVFKGFAAGTHLEGVEEATFDAGTLTFSNLDFVTTDDLATINSVSRRTNSDELAELTSIHAEVVDIQKFNTGANEAEFVGWTAYNFSRNQFSCLFSVSGYLNQDLCEGETITPIEFELVNGSQIANITGLPSGVSYSISGNIVSISGTPSDDIGSTTEYSYTLSTTGCTNSTSNQIQGAITVYPDDDIQLTSNNSDQDIDMGTQISPITFSIGGGATGATVSGLPPGINANITPGELTIFGSVTENIASQTTYLYSVTTIGNCSNSTYTGSITVNPVQTNPTETGILLKGTVSAENNQIKNVADPTDAQDAATKAYADTIVASRGLMNFSGWNNYQVWNDNTTVNLTPNSFVFLNADNTSLVLPDNPDNCCFGDVIYVYVMRNANSARPTILKSNNLVIRDRNGNQASSGQSLTGVFQGGGGLQMIINVGDYWMAGSFESLGD